jgi:outer membrane biosynthesis protein TonB
MYHRLITIFAVICFALGVGGCASGSHEFEDVLMPLQTGSVLHRHTQVRVENEKKPHKEKEEKKEEKTKEEKKKTPKPDAEPSATPKPEEESTPPPADRFR